jgi:agmatinase
LPELYSYLTEKGGMFTNLFDLPEEYTGYGSSAVAVLPVPFDGASTWVRGAEQGPRALIEASQQVELYDIETGTEVYRHGIWTAPPVCGATAGEIIDTVEQRISSYMQDGKFTVVLGGDHSVSIGSCRAHCSAAENLSVLHLDAHSDRRDTYRGSRYSHACAAARFRENAACVVSAGIRSMDSCELKAVEEDTVIFARDTASSCAWMDRVLDGLTEQVYVSIDLDVFDPSVMPSTGTPEPGGLDWYQVTGLLARVAGERRITGLDITELCPVPGEHAPDFLAAKLLYCTLSHVFNAREGS